MHTLPPFPAIYHPHEYARTTTYRIASLGLEAAKRDQVEAKRVVDDVQGKRKEAKKAVEDLREWGRMNISKHAAYVCV